MKNKPPPTFVHRALAATQCKDIAHTCYRDAITSYNDGQRDIAARYFSYAEIYESKWFYSENSDWEVHLK